MIISRVSGAPVRTSSRHRKSIVIACGNFGARPNPPHCGSNCERTLRTAVERISGSMPEVAGAQHVLVDGFGELGGLLLHVVALLVPGLGHDLADRANAGMPCRSSLGKVGAAVERAAVGREPHRHRPTAAAGERLHGLHVDRVDVGPLLAVDLHVHEEPVHDLGDGRVLERLVRHHVTPVARRVADREEDRLAVRARVRRLRRPTDTSRPGCRGAGGGTGSSRPRVGCSWLRAGGAWPFALAQR